MDMPSNMYFHQSYGELAIKETAPLAYYLDLAAQETDPVRRLKFTVSGLLASAFILADITNYVPPYPNMLGETLQATLPNGAEAYFEHLGPSMTDTGILVVGKDSNWKLYGHAQSSIQIRGMNPNTVTAKKMKPFTIEFSDGAKYKFIMPTILIDGVIRTKRVARYTEKIRLEDQSNKIVCEIHFEAAPSTGMLSGWFST